MDQVDVYANNFWMFWGSLEVVMTEMTELVCTLPDQARPDQSQSEYADSQAVNTG